jgi:DNA repair protein RecO (recombination protein O)
MSTLMSVAYILHKRPYRESSSIVEVFTRNYGRLSLLARGSRGQRSKIAGNLLLFTPLVVSWQGKGNLPYLKSAERTELKAPALKNRALLSAMYINELLMYLLHKDDVHEAIFEHYHHCLYSLEDDDGIELVLRIFETRLLELLGFGLNLQTEADTGEQIDSTAIYDYHIEYGPVRSRETTAKSVPRISGICLLALANEQYQDIAMNSQFLCELKQLMRSVMGHHLGNKKLKSRELFRLAGQT